MHWPRKNANSFAKGCTFFSLLELSKNGNRRRGGRGPHFPGTSRFFSMNLRGRLAQLVRAPALQAGSPRFESVTAHHPINHLPRFALCTFNKLFRQVCPKFSPFNPPG